MAHNSLYEHKIIIQTKRSRKTLKRYITTVANIETRIMARKQTYFIKILNLIIL